VHRPVNIGHRATSGYQRVRCAPDIKSSSVSREHTYIQQRRKDIVICKLQERSYRQEGRSYCVRRTVAYSCTAEPNRRPHAVAAPVRQRSGDARRPLPNCCQFVFFGVFIWLNNTSYIYSISEENRKLPASNMTVQHFPVYTGIKRHNAQCYRRRDGRTDGRHYDADSRSYYVTVQ